MPAATEGGARTLPARAVIRVGAVAGWWAGVGMALALMAIGEITAEPTAEAGIRSSTWTALTAIASPVFGQDAFHGSFAPLPLLAGLAMLLAVAVAAGVAGTALIAAALGPRPGALGAAAVGIAYGVALQVAGINAIVNNLQSPNTVYDAVPHWAWWLAHAQYGAVLGIAVARLSRSPAVSVAA